MNTAEGASARSRLGVLATFLGALAVVAGCATTRPAPYLLSSGGIGVAVISPPTAELATEANLAGRGFALGLVAPLPLGNAGPVGLVVGVLIAPFTAAIGAAHGATCAQDLQAAYPGLSAKYAEIVQREFSLDDVRNQFVAVLRERTAVPIAEVEIPPATDESDRKQQLLAAAAQHALAHLFVVKIQNVSIAANIGSSVASNCDSWSVTVYMKVELWSVADRKLVLYPIAGNPFVQGQLLELKSVLDEPGALHSRLVPNFKIAAENMLDNRRFQLPP